MAVLFIVTIIGFFALVFYWLEHHNDPPTKGCRNGKKHKWKMIKDKRSDSYGYTGSVSLWKEFKCEKCGEKQKTNTGIW